LLLSNPDLSHLDGNVATETRAETPTVGCYRMRSVVGGGEWVEGEVEEGGGDWVEGEVEKRGGGEGRGGRSPSPDSCPHRPPSCLPSCCSPWPWRTPPRLRTQQQVK